MLSGSESSDTDTDNDNDNDEDDEFSRRISLAMQGRMASGGNESEDSDGNDGGGY